MNTGPLYEHQEIINLPVPRYTSNKQTFGNTTMASKQTFFDTWTPRGLALLRIVAAFLFLQHGASKLLHFPHVAMFDGVTLFSFMGFAAVLELVGGGLLLLGLFTRPVAFILSGQMAVAYFIAHAPQGNLLSPMMNQGEAAVLYCFVFLFLSLAGSGTWSIDAARRGTES